MKYFCLPADFKKETIDKLEKLNNAYEDCKVIEIYGNITIGNFIGSGRSVELLPAVELDHLKEYVNYAKQRNIGFNYTINASHMHNQEFQRKEMLEIVFFLRKLYKIGVRSLTIALPSLLEIVKSMEYEFEIKSSVICQITNANKAAAHKEMGVQRIVTDESINRDFKTLKSILKVFGDQVEIIVNPVCNKNCTYRMFHYNQIATDSVAVSGEASSNYYVHRCFLKRYKKIGNLLKISWIRPEDLKYYTNIGIKYFKLQGRDTLKKGDIVRAVQSYFKGSYDGDLMQLIDTFGSNSSFSVFIDNKKLDGFLKPFYHDKDFCGNNCESCGYCDTFATKCIDEKKARETYNKARAFYDEYDQFKNVIRSINRENPCGKQKKFTEEDVGFNLS